MDLNQLLPAQRDEIAGYDPELVQAWVDFTDSKPDLHTPVGFFLTGVRSKRMPNDTVYDDTLRLARIRMINLRHCFPTAEQALEEVFGEGGLLRHRETPELRAEFTALWEKRA